MKKIKNVGVIVILLVIVCILINGMATDFLITKLEGREYILTLNVLSIYINALHNFNILKIMLCLFALEGAVAMYIFMDKDKSYVTKLVEIVPGQIKTPAPAGQFQNGSAKWLDKDHFDKTYNSCLIPKDFDIQNNVVMESGGLVVGKKDTKKGEVIYYVGQDAHSISIGATRSGKTRIEAFESIGCLGLAGESIIAASTKTELYDYTHEYLEKLGYDTWIIDFDNPKLSNCINYLQNVINYIDKEDYPGAVDSTWDLVSQLVGEPKGERVWTDGEASVIAGSIIAVCYDNRDPQNHKYRNMTNVYYFIIKMCTPVEGVLPLNMYKDKLDITHPAYALFAVGDIAPSRQRGSFYTGAVMTLKLFSNPYISAMTNISDFSMLDIGQKKTAVFVIVPEERPTYYSLATLLLTQMYEALSKTSKKYGGRLPIRTNYIWDEFGNYPKVVTLINQLTAGTGKGIRFNFFVQDFAQIEKLYEKTGLKTLKNNCITWVYLKSIDDDTNEDISKKLDNYTISTYSEGGSSSAGKKGSSSNSHNKSFAQRRLLTAQEVASINRPYSLVINAYADPAIMYAPDLSKWIFNRLFDMGDEEYNRNRSVIEMRRREEKAMGIPQIDLWGIWDAYIKEIHMMIMMAQMKAQMEAEEKEDKKNKQAEEKRITREKNKQIREAEKLKAAEQRKQERERIKEEKEAERKKALEQKKKDKELSDNQEQ